MTTSRARVFATLALVALVAPACDLMGEPTPEPGIDSLDGGCEEEITILAGVDASSPLGFSAAEVLEVAVGEHASPMLWGAGLSDPMVTVEFGPEAGEGKLTVDVAYNGGEVRYVKSTAKGGEEFDGGYQECFDRLEVDVDVHVASSGGALDESFSAPLQAMIPRIATLSRRIAVDEHRRLPRDHQARARERERRADRPQHRDHRGRALWPGRVDGRGRLRGRDRRDLPHLRVVAGWRGRL